MANRWISATQLADLLGPAALKRPVQHSLADRLRLLSIDGRLVEGLRLPSERDLASRLGLSRSTVTAAYASLRESGVLRARRGAGNFVALSATGLSSQHFPVTLRESDGSIVMTFTAGPAAVGVAEAYATAMAALPQLLAGHGYFPDGLPVLRARLADWYTGRGLPTDPNQLIITSGALAGINLVAHSLLDAGDRVLVESPSYPNALESLRRHGARLVAAPMAEDGWDLDGLTSAVRQSAPKIAYLIPDFHNPTGALMTSAQRRAMGSALRRERCIPMIDETLVDTALEDQPGEQPFATTNADTVTIGSASKAFWGGLRIGWIRAPRSMVQRLVENRASVDLGAAPLEQLVLVHLLENPELILTEQRTRLRTQRDQLLMLLAVHLPHWRVIAPPGGQAVWAELPDPVSSQLVIAAAAEGLIITPGYRFFPAGGGDRHLRLPFTASIPVLTEAVSRLSRAWRHLDRGAQDHRSDPYDLIA